MKKIPRSETRTPRQIIEHYEIEKEIASKLKKASKEERKILYTKLYDELFKRVPHHPQLEKKSYLKHKEITKQTKLLSKFFSHDRSFIEIGAGDCALSIELCKYFKKVYAIDVSEEITKLHKKPRNFKLIISNGTSVDVESESINIAYSNQLIEHLHPDDVLEQLKNIYNVLVPGGIYICQTPHKFMGPADISGYFDDIATGLHLKEYMNKELYYLFKSVGFRKVESFLGAKGRYIIVPIFLIIMIESLINPLPNLIKKKLSAILLIRNLLRIQIIATK